jgi:glycosyltransferase involved in cell wall biosynthesis
LSDPVVAIDADVLGRRRTGDETYVTNLLAELARLDTGLRLVALTRRPDLVPAGIEAYEVPARNQQLRMALGVPRALRRIAPALVHFQYALPPWPRPPAVVTVHDLSFERDPTVMSRADRMTFRAVVPRAVRRAARVLTVSQRTKDDLVRLYGVEPAKVVVTPNGVDPAFCPGPGASGGRYVLFVGGVQARKDPLAALAAAQQSGLPLVVAGPEREPGLAQELRERGADVRGYVGRDELVELYRHAAALVLPSRYEGFGLPVLEAMATGTPVVATPDPAVREVAGDAALYAPRDELGDAVAQAQVERGRLVAAGLERARRFSWAEAAKRTAAVYREVLER